MLYMEETIQQRQHTVNQQLKLINAANDTARAAKNKTLRQRFDDLDKVLELERESGELSTKLKDAESERLKLKYYISEENVSRINKYIEASELLTNRVRRDLLERDSQLRRTEEALVSAWGQLRNLPQSEQEFSSLLHHLSEFLTDSGKRVPCRCELDGQWDKLHQALKAKEEKVAYLQHLLRDQQEEMEAKWAALEEKLLGQTEDGDRHLCEKDESIKKKFSDIKSQLRKELSEKEEALRKELSNVDEDLTGELSETCQQLGKELLQKEEGLKIKVLQISKTELSDRNKKLRKKLCERPEGLEKELLDSTKKALSESEEHFLKELSERGKDFNKNFPKEQFAKELLERNDSFKEELCETAEAFSEELLQMEERLKKEVSERTNSLMKKLLEEANAHKMETSEKDRYAKEVACTQKLTRSKEKHTTFNRRASEHQQKMRSSSVLRAVTVRHKKKPLRLMLDR